MRNAYNIKPKEKIQKKKQAVNNLTLFPHPVLFNFEPIITRFKF